MGSKTIFASMKDKNYDYQAQGIRFLTAFDELVNTETEQLDGYMILACNGGKMELDVNGTRTHLNIWVSPNYLTKVCKEMSAKTAMMWIREYTEQDVCYYLLNSDRSVKEICDDLGFPDLSFFAKFCRRAFGCSPTMFRKKMKTESA